MADGGNSDATNAATQRLVPILFTLTIFLSASLLFFVQPLFAKLVLPLIGGAPGVWTTAMLFFQTILIAGYVYAHLSTRYLPVTAQLALHIFLWAIALFFLPLAVPADWRFDPNTPLALQTLILFAAGVGMPFAVLSANAPLIQSWYAKSDGPSADDPYFLYGASNLGSLSALLAFPLVAEPLFGATQIGNGWAVGFLALGICLCLSGLAARKGNVDTKPADDQVTSRPTVKNYAWWLLLAFIPSSLMLAVTNKISTDIGSFPLVWVLPLALYLLTFVLTFTNKPLLGPTAIRWVLLVSVSIFAMALSGTKTGPETILTMGAFVLAFFGVAIASHRALYNARPDKNSLTIFYVTMSFGGALGGLFNSIIAPFAFVELHELWITVSVSTMLYFFGSGFGRLRDVTYGAVFAVMIGAPIGLSNFLPATMDVQPISWAMLSIFVFGSIYLRKNAWACAFGAVTLLAIGATSSVFVFKDRSFFGSHKVVDNSEQRLYANGTTIHGAQLLSELNEGTRPTPLYYYHPDGPMAQVMNSRTAARAIDVGIVGQGVGSLACYATPEQNWQFYEIDAMVDQIARDPSLFTFMAECGRDMPTHLGDARIVLEQQKGVLYDILVIDAYSSDAVPIHLTTHEAFELYLSRLRPDGILMFHISNRYYDISRPLSRSASALDVYALHQLFNGTDGDSGATPSDVVIMAGRPDVLEEFKLDPRWSELVSDGGRVWTDDFANLLSILR